MFASLRLSSVLLLSAVLATSVNAYTNRVFIIRHGEKVDDNTTGLSAQGMQRAQCLRNVFGASSSYNIGFVITQQYKSDGSRNRPYQTVLPLAQDLGLTINHSCDRDDQDCATNAIASFAQNSGKDILLCWEHDAITPISKNLLKDGKSITYPSSHFDYIYEIENRVLNKNSPYSERCPGLDA